MGNTSAREVHLPDFLMAIVHVPGPVVDGPQRYRLPNEGATDQDLATAEMDQSLLLHLAHLVVGRVLGGRVAGNGLELG